MKEEIYRWVKTIAFFYIVFSAVLHLVPDVKYERYIRSFMGILLIYILSTPVFNLFGNGEKLLQEFRLNYQEELTALEEKNTENLQAQEQERGIRDGLARDFGIEEKNCQLLMGKDEQTTLAGDSASGPFTDGNRISHIENRD